MKSKKYFSSDLRDGLKNGGNEWPKDNTRDISDNDIPNDCKTIAQISAKGFHQTHRTYISRRGLYHRPLLIKVSPPLIEKRSSMSSISNGEISKNQLCFEQSLSQPPLQTRNGFETPALFGINNHGNTCFMNAIIQCLCNTDLLAEYFVMNHYRIDLLRHNKLHARKFGTKGELTEQLALLLKSLWSCMYSSEISSKFKSLAAKYNSQYEGSEQHDAQEFLLWLLDKCHEDLNISTNDTLLTKTLSPNRTDESIAAETLANHMRCNSSFIHDLFQAQLRSSLVCRSCGKHSNTFDPYLCLSLPVPTRLTHTLIVTSVFLNRNPREVKIGVSIESLATIRELRDKISRLLKIPEKQLILLLVGQEFGLKELSKDSDIIQETLEDMENIFAVETPKLPQSYANMNTVSGYTPKNGDQNLTLIFANRIDTSGRLFGPIFSTLVSREASYKQIHSEVLNTMRSLFKHNIDVNRCPNLKLRINNGLTGRSYLPYDVNYPLYMPFIDNTICVDKDYRGPIHLKLIVEWDLDMRDSLIISDDQIDEPFIDSSIELAKARSQKTNRASLRDCFDMYFKEERLVADNAWICTSCRSREQCTKKLSLWSVPDTFIIHLKRFRQSSHSHKVTTQVMFPLSGLDMTSYIVPQTNGNINNVLPALWSPLKRSRVLNRLTRTDDNVFDLYAVCNHRGNMQSGHYTAYCRNPIDNCWYLFDDQKVIPVNESSIVTSDAYILFYQRSSLNSAPSSCSGSSTSGYSSSTGSYYSDQINTGHWAHRMPPFDYNHKSHDNFSDNESNCAKTRIDSPPLSAGYSSGRESKHFERFCATLPIPSKKSKHKSKSNHIKKSLENTSTNSMNNIYDIYKTFATQPSKRNVNQSSTHIPSAPSDQEISNQFQNKVYCSASDVHQRNRSFISEPVLYQRPSHLKVSPPLIENTEHLYETILDLNNSNANKTQTNHMNNNQFLPNNQSPRPPTPPKAKTYSSYTIPAVESNPIDKNCKNSFLREIAEKRAQIMSSKSKDKCIESSIIKPKDEINHNISQNSPHLMNPFPNPNIYAENESNYMSLSFNHNSSSHLINEMPNSINTSISQTSQHNSTESVDQTDGMNPTITSVKDLTSKFEQIMHKIESNVNSDETEEESIVESIDSMKKVRTDSYPTGAHRILALLATNKPNESKGPRPVIPPLELNRNDNFAIQTPIPIKSPLLNVNNCLTPALRPNRPPDYQTAMKRIGMSKPSINYQQQRPFYMNASGNIVHMNCEPRSPLPNVSSMPALPSMPTIPSMLPMSPKSPQIQSQMNESQESVTLMSITPSDQPKQQILNKTHNNFEDNNNCLTRKKRAFKKSVSFSDQVVLVACAEEEQEEYLPNPILDRILAENNASLVPKSP